MPAVPPRDDVPAFLLIEEEVRSIADELRSLFAYIEPAADRTAPIGTRNSSRRNLAQGEPGASRSYGYSITKRIRRCSYSRDIGTR